MPQRCSICTHPKRRYIDRSMLKKSLRKIAEQYHVSYSALHRHKKHIQKALATVEHKNGKSFAQRFEDLYKKLEEIEKEVTKTTDKLAVIREKREMLRMFVQLGFQEALRRQQQEQQREYMDVTPAVKAIIDREFGTLGPTPADDNLPG